MSVACTPLPPTHACTGRRAPCQNAAGTSPASWQLSTRSAARCGSAVRLPMEPRICVGRAFLWRGVVHGQRWPQPGYALRCSRRWVTAINDVQPHLRWPVVVARQLDAPHGRQGAQHARQCGWQHAAAVLRQHQAQRWHACASAAHGLNDAAKHAPQMCTRRIKAARHLTRRDEPDWPRPTPRR